jgi:hypothetical protein
VTARRRTLDVVDDAVILFLIVVSIPVIILAIGTPVALCVRLLFEIARRL